jgi:hypothetical protein
VAALVPVLIVLFVIRRIVDGGHREYRDRPRRRSDRW